jgi:acyl-CoA thioester hydrolase
MHQPFRSSPQTVLPEWIDFNGHLNMAYYNVLFDQSVDELYPHIGFGEDYVRTTGCTTYVAEFHICYLRELHVGDQVTCTFYLVEHDAKRFHSYCELFHSDGWRAATAEGLTLHVDQSGPRVAEMPQNIQDALTRYAATQGPLPDPDRIGRKVGFRRGAQ